MAATFDRTTDLVYDMYELRIPGTPEIDAGMEHIQGVKRGLRGPGCAGGGCAGRPLRRRRSACRPARRCRAPPAAPASRPGDQAAAAAPAPPPPARGRRQRRCHAAPAAAAPTNYDPLTISDEDSRSCPPAIAPRSTTPASRPLAGRPQPPKHDIGERSLEASRHMLGTTDPFTTFVGTLSFWVGAVASDRGGLHDGGQHQESDSRGAGADDGARRAWR